MYAHAQTELSQSVRALIISITDSARVQSQSKYRLLLFSNTYEEVNHYCKSSSYVRPSKLDY